jgi:hypothetical protein
MGSHPFAPTLVLADALPVIAAHHDPVQLAQWLAGLLPPGWSQAITVEVIEHDELVPRFTMLERWLARYLNLEQPIALHVAQLAHLEQLDLPSKAEPWFVARWVHWQATRDHIVLQPAPPEQITPHLAQCLMASAQPTLAQRGWKVWGWHDQPQWVGLTPPSHQEFELVIRSSLVAQGRNIQAYLPEGALARAWRSLHNELQMGWWADSSLQQHQQPGAPPINALWLEGVINAQTLKRWRDAVQRVEIHTAMPELMAALPAAHLTSTHLTSLTPHLDVRALPADPTQLASWWAEHGARLTHTPWHRVVMLGQLHWVELDLEHQTRSKGSDWLLRSLKSLTQRVRGAFGALPATTDPSHGVQGWLR